MKICRTCGSKWRGEGSECPLDGAPLDELPDDLVGRTLAGKYAVTERVGADGMGTAYRARHELVGREVALKVLSPELAPEPVHRERFLREARAANRIDHPNILGITDCGETDDGFAAIGARSRPEGPPRRRA